MTGIQHPWSYVDPGEAFRRTLKLASLVGCPTSGIQRKGIIECLVNISADEIVNKEVGVAEPTLNYSPFVITRDYNKFITMEPMKMIGEKLNQMNNINSEHSVLMGFNKNEGTKALMYFLPRIFPNRELESEKLSKDVFDDSVRKTFDNRMVIIIFDDDVYSRYPLCMYFG